MYRRLAVVSAQLTVSGLDDRANQQRIAARIAPDDDGTVAGLLAITLSGWRYQGVPKVGVSLLTGATSGFLSGLIQLSGPPVIVLWMSGPFPPQTIRANIFVYFAITSVVAVIVYAIGGVFTGDLLPVLVPMIPCYAVGLVLGGRFFGKADPKLFRRVAVALIGAAVILSLPVLDPYLR